MEHPTVDIHKEIIERCKKNDRKAFFEIYNLYSKAMLNTSFRILNNQEEAEDILQDSFINAFQNLHQYRNNATFGAWLKRIVINASLNALKKKKRTDIVHMDNIELGNTELDNTCEEDFNLKIEKVREAINKLPDGYRIVLSLYLLEDYEHKEIATMLGISIATSLSQYHRAKNKLRAILKTSNNER